MPSDQLALSDADSDADADLEGDPEALALGDPLSEADPDALALAEALSEADPAYSPADSSAQVILACRPSALKV